MPVPPEQSMEETTSSCCVIRDDVAWACLRGEHAEITLLIPTFKVYHISPLKEERLNMVLQSEKPM